MQTSHWGAYGEEDPSQNHRTNGGTAENANTNVFRAFVQG